MIDSTNVNSIYDAKVVDPSGTKVGTVKQVYLDNDTGQPTFASVSTGLFGTSESFVPLENATLEGDELRVGYDKDRIKDAPRIDADRDLDPRAPQLVDGGCEPCHSRSRWRCAWESRATESSPSRGSCSR